MNDPVGSPLWWVGQLAPKLAAQARVAQGFQDYYDGKHRLTFVSSKYREAFASMLSGVTDNWMPIVVDAVAERLLPQGMRWSDEPAADADAWEIWQANNLDADARLAHRTALTAGRCALMVWNGADDKPEITVESPFEVFVAYRSGSRRERVAALKSWTDEWTGDRRHNLYLPDGIHKFLGTKTSDRLVELEVVANPLGVVPIVELRNRCDLAGVTRSELAEVTSTQDQINKLVCDMLVAAEFQAFRQRWATGMDVPVDEETQKPVEPFKAAIDHLWISPDENTKFGDFNATDLTIYTKALENRVQSLASRSRTPPHYLLGGQLLPSGESIKAAETGLIAKVHERQTGFGEAWESAMRLAFLVRGDTAKADDMSGELVWADAESRTESEHIDALVKKKAIGVPVQQLWEDAGYSPQQISRFRVMLLEEAMSGLGAPPPDLAPRPPVPVDAGL
jgi:hypothetical protein